MKSKKFAVFIEGEPTVLIMNGKILEKAMKRVRIRITDLLELLRQKDIFDISEVEIAVIEINGTLSVIKKSEYEYVTLKDMKIKKSNKGLNTDIIHDGIILEENMKNKNLTMKWLLDQLNNRNIKDPSEVFYATINSSGNIFISKYEDQNNENEIPLTYSNKEDSK